MGSCSFQNFHWRLDQIFLAIGFDHIHIRDCRSPGVYSGGGGVVSGGVTFRLVVVSTEAGEGVR